MLWVGDDPKPVPYVRGASVGSGYTMPFRIIPDRSEAPENDFQAVSAKAGDVLNDDDFWPALVDEPEEFEPQPGSLAGKPIPASGLGQVLAGEPSAKGVNGNSICCETFGTDSSDIVITGHLWPMLRQLPAAEWADFAEGDRLEARALKAKVEATYPCEQRKNPHQKPAFSQAMPNDGQTIGSPLSVTP